MANGKNPGMADMNSTANLTAENPFALDAEPRQLIRDDELRSRLTSLFSASEGCEDVAVVGVTRLDSPDSAGCNWSRSLVLDPKQVAAPVYALAYAQVLELARQQWNLA